jgi:hypothetical protein
MELSTAGSGRIASSGGGAAVVTADLAADRIAAPQKLQDPYYSDFLIGLMTPEQRNLLVEFGHGRHMHIDATHGTNNAKVFIPQSVLRVCFMQYFALTGTLINRQFYICCAVSADHHHCDGSPHEWSSCGVFCAQPRHNKSHQRLLVSSLEGSKGEPA